MKFNGKEYEPFNSAFNDKTYSGRLVGRPITTRIPHRRNKVTTLDAVMELIRDGDTISYPHYYRFGDKGLQLVVEKLRETGKRDIRIYGNAFFDHVDPWLIEAVKAGTIGGIYGNVYRKFGGNVVRGDLLPWVSVGFSHGNRVRKLQTGEVDVRVAFGPVPMADVHGNANGVLGRPEHLCGPVGLFSADAEYARYVCLLAGTVSDKLIMPTPLSMEQVDFVVKVDDPGLSSGIGSGTLDVEKAKSNPFNARVAENITRVIKAAGVVRDGFAFQVGSGAGLLILENIRNMLKETKIRANFSIGGVTSLHVDMLDEGTLYQLMHGQLFEPSPKVFDSLLTNHHHHEITTAYYASVANKEAAVNMLDLAVLSTLEVDREFNLNTVCANGRTIGGIGGGQDVAAGADLAIIFMPLATGKDGKGFPKVVDRVYTRTTPGEVIDVVVTEEYAAVNPKSKSTYRDSILERGGEFGVKLISMDELHEKSVARAGEFGIIPPQAETSDEVVHVIEWRDGSLLDVIRRIS
ncbi:MAG TPA: citrate lyase subunit alpha [Acidobacteriota bacterium]|nr:citrate lyase subunit alpha [Acidobacteriota bacterium]